MRILVALALVVALAAPGAVAAPSAGTAGPVSGEPTHPLIVAVGPNPVADGDVGEFVVVDAPPETNLFRYVLDDGEERLRLPNRTLGGEVVLTAAPERHRNRTDRPVLDVTLPSLSNAGETLRIQRGGDVVSVLRYENAPEGERFRNGTWQPLGASDYPVVRGGSGTARAFVLPDAPSVPLAPIRNASERVLLAGYTLTSKRVTGVLVAAANRGATVRVLLEGAPVGGVAHRQARRLDTLVAAGVSVRLVTGEHTRYEYHHAKYAVTDDRAVVMTENWKPSGTGGRSSRGWGVIVSDGTVVDGLVRTFSSDFAWRAATPWREFRRGRTFTATNASRGEFPTRTGPSRVPYRSVSLLVAPDNAGSALTERLRRANESIRVVQMSVGGPDQRFLRAAVDAARRGVDVRLLLSGAWYVRDDNAALAERLDALASREELPLSVRLAEPSGFEKIHAKGVIVDDTVVLGSLNWNEAATTRNREVLLALTGPEIAGYYRSVFDADWRASASGGEPTVPVGLVAVLVVVAAGCLLAARRLEFD